jgi:hypothetical protein
MRQIHNQSWPIRKQRLDPVGPLHADDGIRRAGPFIPSKLDQLLPPCQPICIDVQKPSAARSDMLVNDAEGWTGHVIDAKGPADRGGQGGLPCGELTSQRDDIAPTEQRGDRLAEAHMPLEIG